ncbi:MAG: GGDEF domain-containing protein [Candidatus Omnitrophota bacterium]|nr:GGDEF domain-containing protein [Candidatus Omnitrophota bacterium]
MLEQMQKDGLTGFFTRENLSPLLEKLLLEAKMGQKKFSLALIDLDRFKKFNDKFGHIFGDEILKYATSTLRLTFSMDQCSFFRYGGDEFIGVFPGKEPKEILRLGQQCNYNLLHRPFLYANKFYKITMSCGISCFPTDATTADELIKKADEAMYFSKRSGRNLTTLASMIKYLKFRRVVLMIASSIIILYSVFLFYKLSFKKIIQPVVRQIQNIKITTKPVTLDTVILKSGAVLEGNIVYEDENKVIFNLYLKKGEGVTNFNKSEIARIKYGSGNTTKNIEK